MAEFGPNKTSSIFFPYKIEDTYIIKFKYFFFLQNRSPVTMYASTHVRLSKSHKQPKDCLPFVYDLSATKFKAQIPYPILMLFLNEIKHQ